MFSVLHEPTTIRFAPVVFCHPFAEEKLWAHRVFVSFARVLAGAGYPVLRFDYRGNGDSDGRFEDASIESAVEDVRCGVQHVRQRFRSDAVHLLGLRVGASVACRVAAESSEIDQLMLWAPIVDGAAYMKDLLRVNLSTQVALYKEVRQDRDELVQAMRAGHHVNIDGYDLSWTMFSQASAIDLLATRSSHQRPCLIVEIETAGRRQPSLPRLAQQFADATLVTVAEEAFWKEIPAFYGSAPRLFDATRAWQSSRQAPASDPS